MNQRCRLLAAMVSCALASCATGAAEDWDTGIHDAQVEDMREADSLPPDLPVELPDVPFDPTDVPVDSVDSADVVAEDTGVDPGTCTRTDLVTQTMCASGYKCTFTSVDTSGNPVTFCDVAGAQGWNQTCGAGGASDNCQRGYMCLTSGGGTDSRCRRFCSSDTQCTSSPGGPNASCQITVSVGGTTALGVTMCSFHCDLISQSPCDTSQGCRSIDLDLGDTGYWTDCTQAGTGSGCIAGTASDCPRGQDCFTVDTTNFCLAYCTYPYGFCSTGSCTQGTGWPSTIGVCY